MEFRKNQWLPAILLTCISLILLFIYPDTKINFISALNNYSMELISVLPAVLLLMGLFSVFVSNDFISHHLGQDSGAKGIFLSFILGALPTGPIYIAFPIASTLLSKGAKVANIYIFLSTWACIKLPQEFVELRFLGFKFTVYRLVLTSIFIFTTSFAMEQIAGIKTKSHPKKDVEDS